MYMHNSHNMMRTKIGGLFLLALLLPLGAAAQLVTSMRINEVLVINDSNFVDGYGQRHAWVELYNSSAGTVNIAGCFLTNDKSNPRMYPVPKGDVLTRIPPRQHILFWTDGNASHGTFHTNFTLDPDKDNYIAFYDADGLTLVDEITIPAGQLPDVSYGRKVDGKDEWEQLAQVTPSTNNLTLDSNEKIDNFKRNDGLGIGMTLSAMAVVFIGLLMLYLIFKQIARIAVSAGKKRAEKSAEAESAPVAVRGAADLSGEVLAAIATALHELEEDRHDVENTVLTINKVKRNYSPWSSKIYTLREIPRR
jgi:Na+-transporting methylmalonyl-CoA/oxaloacetate decarboxylase gamma subunit